MAEKNDYPKMILFLLITLQACMSDKKNEGENASVYQIDKCNLIFYQFPERAMRVINYELKDQPVVYAIVSVSESDVTSLHFMYSEKSNRAIALANKSNRTMELNGTKIPLLFASDFLFASESKDTVHWIQDFNFAIFKFDKKGNIMKKIKF